MGLVRSAGVTNHWDCRITIARLIEGRHAREAIVGNLLASRRFLPLFATQALGAFNDNLFKNALVVLILVDGVSGGASLIALAGGIFILPFALFSAIAGQLADRYDKARLIRWTKLFEIGLMVIAAIAFLAESIDGLLLVLFGLGVQATFFGPLKYGILPDHLAEAELVEGNARIEAATFIAILLGTVAGSFLIALPQGREILSVAGLLVAIAGFGTGLAVPPAPAADATLKIGWNLFTETMRLIHDAMAVRPVWLAILGISWFWNFGAVLLAEFPVVAMRHLHAESSVVTLLLTMFALGIGVGATLVGRLLNGEISARHVPWAGVGLTVFTLDFAYCCLSASTSLTTVGAIIMAPAGWRLLVDLCLLAVCGGVYSVPLYAILQERSASSHRARMVAANNVMNAVFMVSGAAVVAGVAALGISAPIIMAGTAILNIAVLAWAVPIARKAFA